MMPATIVSPQPSPPAEVEAPERVALPDGTPVVLRAVRPDDEARLRRMFFRLSPETIYQRYHAPLAAPPASVTLCPFWAGADGRYAALALIDDEVVGVARYARFPAGAGAGAEADLGIVVEDAWQRRGVGRLLLARLACAARSRGIVALTGTALGDNRGIIRLIGAVFPWAVWRLRHGEYEIRIPMSDATAPLC